MFNSVCIDQGYYVAVPEWSLKKLEWVIWSNRAPKFVA